LNCRPLFREFHAIAHVVYRTNAIDAIGATVFATGFVDVPASEVLSNDLVPS
jgi:hypothetical protein